MTLQYAPTKNLNQILRAEDYAEREVFEFEAVKEAQNRFKAGLKKAGYSSVEAMMEALRGEEESELLKHVCIAEREAEELHFKATNPFASPAESFELEVSAMEVEERLYWLNCLQFVNAINKVTKRYKPTMNLNQAFKKGDDVLEAYTLEGQKEGRKRFEARLKREGYASVEDWEKALRAMHQLDLLFYAMSLEDELAGWSRQAFDPNISPEESFDCMASAYQIGNGIRVIDKIVGGHEPLMLRFNPSEEM